MNIGAMDLHPAAAAPPCADVYRRAARLIVALDEQIATLLCAIRHHAAFQALEALWRSVGWLCDTAGRDDRTVIRIVPVRWRELATDLERAGTVDNSELYRKVYDEAFGIAGGQPFGMIVIPHAVGFGSAGHDDLGVLRSLAEVGAATFCPFVLGYDPAVLDMAGFADHDVRRDVLRSVDGVRHARWRSFRQSPDSRYIVLAGPRLLLRAPEDCAADRDIGSVYAERSSSHSDYLWTSAAFAVAHVAVRAHRDDRWPAGIRGTPEQGGIGGVLDGLPDSPYPMNVATALPRPPLDAALTEAREGELVQLGLLMVRPCYFTGHVALYNTPSVHAPAKRPEGQPNLEGSLHYTLCVSRFAHYVKVMVRDWVGSHLTAALCEARLQEWIDRFCNADAPASAALRARFPLRQAQVTVTEALARPGSFHCTMWIKPHFQTDQVVSELRLQTTLLDAA